MGMEGDKPLGHGRLLIRRHPVWVRATHWINALAVALLMMSGMQIFNAHPALYWGHASDFAHPWLTLQFPDWATVPSYRDLASGRRWHFFFAWLFVLNGLAYLVIGLLSGRLRRALTPRRAELAPARLRREALDHLRLRFVPRRGYNTLQKTTYLAMVVVVLPMMLVTGISMSPGMNAALGWLVDLLGGRQSGRSLHFLSAGLLAAFVVVHVAMVVAAGPVNHMRSIITGRFVIPVDEP